MNKAYYALLSKVFQTPAAQKSLYRRQNLCLLKFLLHHWGFVPHKLLNPVFRKKFGFQRPYSGR
jgi:uncharacterized membrane protein